MTVEKIHDITDGALSKESVGVDKQHIVALCLSDGDVVGLGKAEVMETLDDPRLWVIVAREWLSMTITSLSMPRKDRFTLSRHCRR